MYNHFIGFEVNYLNIIDIKKLSKYYGKAKGVADLSLSVDEGEFFGFIGPNGAGKSTTIRVLLGLIYGEYERLAIFEKDMLSHKEEILQDVGYMTSEVMFYNGMKVKDIIKFAANTRKKDCTDEAKRLCDILQLDTTRKIEELSLGNRKKVAIVCAMQHQPKLYILDEPTSGLDPLIQHEFFNLLKQRNSEGATIFLSSHVLSEIQRYCDKAAIIRDGHLVANDNVENLIKTKVRQITIHGHSQVEDIDGVFDCHKIDEKTVSFFYEGDIKQLLKRLEKTELNDILISEPDLEAAFMHYYKDETRI